MVARQVRRKKKNAHQCCYISSCLYGGFVYSVQIKKKRQLIMYAPMEERDKNRIDYLNTRIYKDDTTCIKMIRLKRGPFFQLCRVLRERSLLYDTIHVCIEEQVAIFLNTIGHNLRNRLVGTNFIRSGETISRYFNLVLRAIGELSNELIRPPSLIPWPKLQGTQDGIHILRYDKLCRPHMCRTHCKVTIFF